MVYTHIVIAVNGLPKPVEDGLRLTSSNTKEPRRIFKYKFTYTDFIYAHEPEEAKEEFIEGMRIIEDSETLEGAITYQNLGEELD